MDLAKTLIRSVVRAFYETRHVLVIDALMIHSALPNEDLALLMGMQQKDLRKLCGKLKEDRLLAVHSRQEIREGQQRPINKDYYYIDFHSTIDAIKYRIFCLTQKVKDMYKPSEEKKDFHCPRCKAQWTQLEVLDKMGPEGFLCHRCDAVLERDDRSAGDSGGHEKQSKLMSQLEYLLKLLQQIDSEDIPNNDFETAFSVAVPVERDEQINPTRITAPIESGRGPTTTVKGNTQNTLQPLEITMTTNTERTAAEQVAEAQRKAEIAAQNVLPEWHTRSTVTGESTTVVRKEPGESLTNGAALSTDKAEEERQKKKGDIVLNDELAAYYAQMAQEQAKEAREDREAFADSGDDEDEDDNDFEDVAIGASSAIATPSSTTSAPTQNGLPKDGSLHNGGGLGSKRESESGSSAPGTNMSTPAGSQVVLEGEDGPPAAKKVKVESEGVPVIEIAAAAVATADGDSDEDDGDFEDAL